MIFVKISSIFDAIPKLSFPKATHWSAFLLGFSFMILVPSLLCSCASQKSIQSQIVEKVAKDTIYINKQSYDSIHIDNTHLIDRGGDTVYIKDKLIEYRFRLLRDTIRIARIDSIPYEVKIIETKEVRKPPNLFDYLCYLSFGFILGILLWKLYRVIKFL